jgi:PTH2 family peptidyl-tRNA hydrolase
METKQVIVMRKDLNMRKGKMVAQGAHAAIWALLNAGRKEVSETGDFVTYTIQVHTKSSLPLDRWLLGNYKKICVSVNGVDALQDIFLKATAHGLPCHIQWDDGETEFKGVPTITCCAIGPSPSDVIDTITGHLPLL